MILAHKILLPTLEKKDPELEGRIRVPDTWYLNSGVFSEFLDRNNLYLFHTFKYKDRESIEKEFLRIEEQFKFATFAPEVVEDFRKHPGGDRGAPDHHPILQHAGGQLRPGVFREVHVGVPHQPGRHGDAPEPTSSWA